MCSTNMSLPGNAVDMSDPIEIECSVRYNGIWTPVFSCADHLPGTTTSNTSSDSVLYSRVIAAADIEDFTELNCFATFTMATDFENMTTDMPSETEKPVFNFVWNARGKFTKILTCTPQVLFRV